MYLREISIQGVRSIASLKWSCTESDPSGWHVFIGANGSGKTTALRCIALALLGTDEEMFALRQDWGRWVRDGDTTFSECRLTIERSPEFDPDCDATRDDDPTSGSSFIYFSRNGSPRRGPKDGDEDGSFSAAENYGSNLSSERGWFHASYGPIRRFTGDDEQDREFYRTYPRLAAHLTLFHERYALSSCIPWLISLDHRAANAHRTLADKDELASHKDVRLLQVVKQFINTSDLLPHGVQLRDITDSDVFFEDGNGARVQLQELSDGYRSVLAMTLDILRQLLQRYDVEQVFDAASPNRIKAPGVVLIDEVDAHLHPTWQRDIGFWFRRTFPAIQFFVTTHSMVVCWAASRGSIYRLPAPGSDKPGSMIEGVTRDRLIYGNVLDASGTELFGADVARSHEATGRLRRLSELNRKKLRAGLTDEEQAERDAIRASIPTEAR